MEGENEIPGSVLIFLPGISEIHETEKQIIRFCKKNIIIEKLHSSLPRDKRTMHRIMTPLRSERN
jgi:HrpA-like RNA helicase